MYKGCATASTDATPKLSQKEFYYQLTEELIDNNQDKERPLQEGELILIKIWYQYHQYQF